MIGGGKQPYIGFFWENNDLIKASEWEASSLIRVVCLVSSCPSFTSLTQALTNSLVMRFPGSSFIMVVLFICFPMHV